jgi:hypothetical protein
LDASEAENQRGALDVRQTQEAAVKAIAQHVQKFLGIALILSIHLISAAFALGSSALVVIGLFGLFT